MDGLIATCESPIVASARGAGRHRTPWDAPQPGPADAMRTERRGPPWCTARRPRIPPANREPATGAPGLIAAARCRGWAWPTLADLVRRRLAEGAAGPDGPPDAQPGPAGAGAAL